MSANNPYFVEVVESHELIQRWFANASASEALCEQLLSHFSPAFTMVGMSGMLLNYPAVCAFFRANGGGKAGLSIEVSEMTIIVEWENGAVVSYKETQTQPEQPKTVRFSTAVFEKGSQGNVIWRHLHETAAHL
ncbi:DUF4440 domain-containing protein [Obesumbacterium proteus]|uniref:Cytoplasmic protein n=1 Tax=Obesumbacterium proteus ATCC 12841 TaxID=1354268 RepID=A0AA91EJU4_9GAMM|nr:DUF4440 domain-containing protein [Obesumbacterium proteus]AMO80622.1 DUF4440 domain-containing protein [Obesumbacterium proteus]OAT60214.1 putative cytoplasmic protein [Obesumbacterium proteus ATCC 12841]